MKAGLVGLFLAPLCGAADWLKGVFGELAVDDLPPQCRCGRPLCDSWPCSGFYGPAGRRVFRMLARCPWCGSEHHYEGDRLVFDGRGRLGPPQEIWDLLYGNNCPEDGRHCFACDGGLMSDWDSSRGPLPLCRTHLQLWSAPRI